MKRETNDCIKTTNEKQFIQVTFELSLYALSICFSVEHFKDIKNCNIFPKKNLYWTLLSKLVVHSSPGLVILKLLTDQMSKYTEVLGSQSSHSVRKYKYFQEEGWEELSC